MPEEQVGEAVPADQKQGWGQFLKSLATFSGDLSSMTAPSFVLSPVSLTEYASYWGEHPELLDACKEGADDIEKMCNVLRWFISTLRSQYMSRNDSMGMEKKPLNPILGEQFFGKWPAQGSLGETDLVAEQVSHHPPITAYCLENKKSGIVLEGHNAQKTSFSGRSIHVKQVGHGLLRVKNKEGSEDKYLITLPQLSIEGLWYGAPYVEASGKSYISSSTGYLATIEFAGKGYFSGKAHTFKATVSPSSQASHALYTVEGQWSDVSKYKGKGPAGSDVFWDATAKRNEVTVAPLEQQGPLESQQVWKLVSEGIRTGNYDVASREKSKIENEQRQKRKDEAAASKPHELKYFDHIDNDAEYEELMGRFKGTPPTQDGYRRKTQES